MDDPKILEAPTKQHPHALAWGGLGSPDKFYEQVYEWVSEDAEIEMIYTSYCDNNRLNYQDFSNVALMLNDGLGIQNILHDPKLNILNDWDSKHLNIVLLMIKIIVDGEYSDHNHSKLDSTKWKPAVIAAAEPWAKVLPIIRKGSVLWDNVIAPPILGSKTHGIVQHDSKSHLMVIDNSLITEWDDDDLHTTTEYKDDKFEYDAGWAWNLDSKKNEYYKKENFNPNYREPITEMGLTVHWVNADKYFIDLRKDSKNANANKFYQSIDYIWQTFGLSFGHSTKTGNNHVNIPCDPKWGTATNILTTQTQKIMTAECDNKLVMQQEQMVAVQQEHQITQLNSQLKQAQRSDRGFDKEDYIFMVKMDGKKISSNDMLKEFPILMRCADPFIEPLIEIGSVWKQLFLRNMYNQLWLVARFIAKNQDRGKMPIAVWIFHLWRPIAEQSKYAIYLCDKYDLKQWLAWNISSKYNVNKADDTAIELPLWDYPRKIMYKPTFGEVTRWVNTYFNNCYIWGMYDKNYTYAWIEILNMFAQLNFLYNVFTEFPINLLL